MTFRLGVAAGAAAILSLPNPAAAQALTQRDVSLHMALTIAQTASQECEREHVRRRGRSCWPVARVPSGRQRKPAQQ